MRTPVISTLVALGTVVGAIACRTRTPALPSQPLIAQPRRLSCLRALLPCYTANGNFQPLFCKIDNPLALKFYRPIARHLFA